MLKIILSIFLLLPSVLFGSINFNEREVKCIADTVYYEARSLGNKEKIFIIQVIVNRSKDERFPNDICNIVYQKRQFSWTRLKNLEIKEKEEYDSIVNLVKNFSEVDHKYLFFEKKSSLRCFSKYYRKNFCHVFRRNYAKNH